MKTHLRFLLVLVSMMFVLGGCQNPSGPEIPEVNEPPVVEIPKDNVKLTKVEFRWGAVQELGGICGRFEIYSPMYLLGLYDDPNSELNDYLYGFPEGYDTDSYIELCLDTERFKKFSEDAFEKVFGTKYYEEGTVIDLKKWTYPAMCVAEGFENIKRADRLYFSIEDYYCSEDYSESNRDDIFENAFDEIVVGNEDIIVYVFFIPECTKYDPYYGL